MITELAARATAVTELHLPHLPPLQPHQYIGIPIALAGAVCMAIGAQLQHRGVVKVDQATEADSSKGLGAGQMKLLLRRPSWAAGTLMLGLAIVLQLISLAFAPLIIVQPLGAVSLVITAIVNARVSGHPLNRSTILALCLCVGGVGSFVFVAATAARDVDVSESDLITILIVLAVVLVVVAGLFLWLRHRGRALGYIIGAGVLYGFVATLAKAVISRIEQKEIDVLTLLCVVGLLLAVILGAYFVQNAYASGPPDLVVAGLTVIDPLVAVTIGIVILDEAAGATTWQIVSFLVLGVIAVIGVLLLARVHPGVEHAETDEASGDGPHDDQGSTTPSA
jgi:drug/metabolite transporter (DMT)-like permease